MPGYWSVCSACTNIDTVWSFTFRSRSLVQTLCPTYVTYVAGYQPAKPCGMKGLGVSPHKSDNEKMGKSVISLKYHTSNKGIRLGLVLELLDMWDVGLMVCWTGGWGTDLRASFWSLK